MSIFSAIAAENHNNALKEKAKDLRIAIATMNWAKVHDVLLWLQSEPFGE